jgi:hypothetical protein
MKMEESGYHTDPARLDSILKKFARSAILIG